jgi:hypothetical protein
MRKLGRFFSRELARDQINKANGQIRYAKEHRLIGEHEEPTLARELAPRKVKKALRKIERDRQPHKDPDTTQQVIQPGATSTELAKRQPLLLPSRPDADQTTTD